MAKPFTALDHTKYSYNRIDNDVYKLLMNSVSMRGADDYKFEGKAESGSVYARAADSLTPFQNCKRLAKSRTGLLPPGCNYEKQNACEDFGMSGDSFSNLKKKTTKEDVQKHYGHEKMPVQLRMLGEAVLLKD